VIDLFIVGVAFDVLVERQEPRMFARAVVMHLARLFICADQVFAGLFVVGRLRAAAEIVVGIAQILKPSAHAVGMDFRTLMGRARQRQLFGCQVRACTTFEQRQSLDHLARRARKNHSRGITPSMHDFACFVTHDSMTLMHAFQQIIAPDFDQIDGVSHG